MKILNNETTDTAGIQAFCGIKFRNNPADKDKISEIKNQIKDIISLDTVRLNNPEVPNINFYDDKLNFNSLPLKIINFKDQYKNNYSKPLSDVFSKKTIKTTKLREFKVPDFNRYVHFLQKLDSEDLYTKYFNFWVSNYKSLNLHRFNYESSNPGNKLFYNSDNYKIELKSDDSILTSINYTVDINRRNQVFPFLIHSNITDIRLPVDTSTISERIDNSLTVNTIDKISLNITEDSFTDIVNYYYLDFQTSTIKNYAIRSGKIFHDPKIYILSQNYRIPARKRIDNNMSYYFNSNKFLSEIFSPRGEKDKNKLNAERCLSRFSFTKRNTLETFTQENLSVVLLNSNFLDFHISNIQKECLIYFADFYNSNPSIVKSKLSKAIEDFCFLIISCVNVLIQTNDEEVLSRSLTRGIIKNYSQSLLALRKVKPLDATAAGARYKNSKSLSKKINTFNDSSYGDLGLNLIVISQNANDIIYFVKKIYNAMFFNLDLSDNFSKEEILSVTEELKLNESEESNRTSLSVKVRKVLFDKMSGNFVKTIIE